MRHFFYFVILFLYSNLTYSASFDCTKAKSETEIAICSDKELDELDSQLGASYTELKKIFSTDFYNKIIIKSQRQWIKNRSKNVENLKKNYKERIKLLKTSAIPVFGYKSFENKIDSVDPFIIKIQKESDGIEIISSDLFMSKREIINAGDGRSPRCETFNKLFRKSDGKSLNFKEVFDATKKNLLLEKIYELTYKDLKERGEIATKKEIIGEISEKLEDDFNEVAINSKFFSINHFLSRPAECADTEISMPTKALEQLFTPYMRKQLGF